jgi:hypothetical protein
MGYSEQKTYRTAEEKAQIKQRRKEQAIKKAKKQHPLTAFEPAVRQHLWGDKEKQDLGVKLYRQMVTPFSGKRLKKMTSQPLGYLPAIRIACDFSQYLLTEKPKWEPKAKKANQVTWEYLQYLYAKYPVPSYLFTDLQNFSINTPFRDWWIETVILISQGGSAVKLLQARIPQLSKKDCRRFLSLEKSSKKVLSFSLAKKLRYCQARNRGCTHEQACALTHVLGGLDPLPEHIDDLLYVAYDYQQRYHETDEGFINRMRKQFLQLKEQKLEFVVWAGQQSFIMPNTLQDMYDWYKSCKEADPDWTIIGQSAARVFERTKTWEERQAREAAAARQNWYSYSTRPEVPETLCQTTFKPFQYSDSLSKFSIAQITTRSELAREGDVMHHCVYSYRHDIHAGKTIICSLRNGTVDKWEKSKPSVTIEIKDKTVVQARQACNQYCSPSQEKAIKKWAIENMLEIGSYVFDEFQY